ncbi:MAG: CPBP family intramembrane metalloprotease [Planctomycetia bacterium]|nr:CPBP family intramembrane metalloprotease [Planctomycetia bacterium]
MTTPAALPSAGFEYAVLVYLGAAVVSFAAAGSIFWRRRRQAGRHVPTALAVAFLIAVCQLVVVTSLSRVKASDYEGTFFRDTMHTSAMVFLPAFFVSAFVMAASGAYLSELAGTQPFPLSHTLAQEPRGVVRPAVLTLLIAGASGAAGLAYSVALFKGCEVVTGKPPQPAPGTEDLAAIFAGNVPLVLAFGLAAAIWEEVFVRLFLLNGLRWVFRSARGGTVAAVVVSSAIWAAGHAGTMNPELVKFLQVFPIGLLFSLVYLRRGAETTLAAHAAFNAGILFLGGFQ